MQNTECSESKEEFQIWKEICTALVRMWLHGIKGV